MKFQGSVTGDNSILDWNKTKENCTPMMKSLIYCAYRFLELLFSNSISNISVIRMKVIVALRFDFVMCTIKSSWSSVFSLNWYKTDTTVARKEVIKEPRLFLVTISSGTCHSLSQPNSYWQLLHLFSTSLTTSIVADSKFHFLGTEYLTFQGANTWTDEISWFQRELSFSFWK